MLMPLGFSYLSFELLHVVIERRRGKIRELSFPDLLAFVFFATARVAGPIKRISGLHRRRARRGLRAAPTVIAAISYFLTFLVVGAWHGVTAAFLLWGPYHGLLLAAYHCDSRQDTREDCRASTVSFAHRDGVRGGRDLPAGRDRVGAVHDELGGRPEAARVAVRRRAVRALANDLIVGFALALLIVALMLFVSFDSTFIYQRF
jgi:hypothetical protein